MSVPLPWYALAVITTLLNASTLGIIARREGSRALGLWTLAWAAWGLAVIPLVALGSPGTHPFVGVLCGLLWVVSSLFFLRGAYAFGGRATARIWYAVAGVCIVVAVALGVGPQGAAGMVPLVLFQSVGLWGTGVIILRTAEQRTGAWLCGVALIGLGLHVLDAPVLASRPEWFLWGFVLAIALQVLAALGMLMLYYEHARAKLVDTERALGEARRIEALGRIAGGVAHDFNNMLTVMQGHADLLSLEGDQADMRQESLHAMEEAIDRASRLTSQLLAFGRRSVVQNEAIDVGAVVRGTVDLLGTVTPATIDLTFHCEEGPLIAAMDRSLLEQIVLNLVVNARDAISGSGTIRVELDRLEGPQRSLVVRVTDDGMGMDEETRARIFEPFFTSKPEGRGTGLGLASVQGAISQLGGEIHVTSELDRGTRFEVVLPWVAATASAPPRSEAQAGSSLAILVVDDDRSVRQTTQAILRASGHEVDVAADGSEALEKLRMAKYDLVVSDVLTASVGGVDLARELAERWPQTAIVLTSGYPRNAGLDTGRITFLPKPFKRNDLLNVVRRVSLQRQQAKAG